jgi:translation initiation factor 5B
MAKKDKKKAKPQDDYWNEEFQNDVPAEPQQQEPAATATPPAAAAAEEAGDANGNGDPAMDDLADDFGGLMAMLKRNKGKKGKKQQKPEMVDANEELEAMDQDVQPQKGTPAPADDDEPAAEDGGEFRVKTKKEKEKEKKEKEKAKKKAQVRFPLKGESIF